MWNMKSHKINYDNPYCFKGCYISSDSLLRVLDENERILVYEFTSLQSKIFYNYEKYVHCPDDMMQVVESHKMLNVTITYLPVRNTETQEMSLMNKNLNF